MTRSDPRATRFLTQERALLYGVATFLVYLGLFAIALWQRNWFIQPDGKPVAVDFLNFWSAGFITSAGHVEQLYDLAAHKTFQVDLIGHDFAGYYQWPYPPTLLLLVAPLAHLPYLIAWLAWISSGLAFFAASLLLIVPIRLAAPLALAAPASLWCMAVGQNGFLTAGLVACALALLKRRPMLAGVCFAMLTYKPQFGLVIPLFLIANRNGKAIVSATLATIALVAASTLVFGTSAWRAFAVSLFGESGSTLLHLVDLSKIQSFYAILARWTGEPRVALVGHLCFCAALVAPLVWLWRRDGDPEVKYAALVAAAFLFSPYAYIYDAVLLTVGVAFLVQDGLRRGFLSWDKPLLFLAWAAPALFGLLESASAPLGAALILVMSFRRTIVRSRNTGERKRIQPATAGFHAGDAS